MPYHQIKNCSACGKNHLIQFKHVYEILPETGKRKLVYKGICKNTGIEVYKDNKEEIFPEK